MQTNSFHHVLDIDFLHEIRSRMAAAADPPDEAPARMVNFVSAVIQCDSCFVYVLEGEELVLRASKNPHEDSIDRLKLRVGRGITGWVAEHREPVAIAENAAKDVRFKTFNELPEDSYQSFLAVPVMTRGRVVGIINLQHRQPQVYTARQLRLISTLGFLAGAEIEMARLEGENSSLLEKFETRKLLERAKGIPQRDLGIDEEQAYLTLQRQSRQKRKSLREMAEAVVLGEEIRRKSQAN